MALGLPMTPPTTIFDALGQTEALQRGNLQNQILRQRLAEQRALAPVQEQIAQAKLRDLTAPAQPQLQSTFGKAFRDVQLLRQQLGPNAPEVKLAEQNLQRMAVGQRGLQVGFGPQGQLSSLSFGGTAIDPTTGQAIRRVPGTGSARSGQGAVFQEEGGRRFATLTPAQVTQTQRSLQAIDRTTPQLKELPRLFKGFLGPVGAYKARAYRFGGKDAQDAFNRYQVGQTQTRAVAESLMKAYGLPSTEGSLRMVYEMVNPDRWDTDRSYNAKIKRVLEDLERFKKTGESQLVQLPLAANNKVRGEQEYYGTERLLDIAKGGRR